MSTQTPLRVLVADDSIEVARRIGALLRETGFVDLIGPAPDGVVALELFYAHRPDVVVLDLAMPRCDGLEVLRKIRSSGDSCIVIIITSNLDESIRDACLSAGADHYFLKSEDLDNLEYIMSEFHERRNL